MPIEPIISISNLNKSYANGFQALNNVNLDIETGEIFALLGPNGAGKTTMISIICGLNRLSSGEVKVGGHNVVSDYKKARQLIGLVPQEISLHTFETVINTVAFSRGLFGLAPNPELIENLLKKLSLWDKKDNKLMTLSGGMKRRLMIAKALAHEPRVLFLDEPTAGVDVELRKDMWEQVRELKSLGVTIILTTHYIEEAEEMADRVGVISKGNIILVEKKNELMKKMSAKEIKLTLSHKVSELPSALDLFSPKLKDNELSLSYEPGTSELSLKSLFQKLNESSIEFVDLESKQTSLEEIFVNLVEESK